MSSSRFTEPNEKSLSRHKNRIVDEVRDTMVQEQIKYKQISAKVVGSNVVLFRLEDETMVKVHVDMARVGVAVDRKNQAERQYTISVQP
jgi:hypothetical protein